MLLLVLLTSCGIRALLPEVPVPNCEPRRAFYEDTDGDGLGEPTAIYIGCEAPPGYVATLDTDVDSDTDVVDSDTDVVDSDTDVVDTDTVDTDTDVVDTDTGP